MENWLGIKSTFAEGKKERFPRERSSRENNKLFYGCACACSIGKFLRWGYKKAPLGFSHCSPPLREKTNFIDFSPLDEFNSLGKSSRDNQFANLLSQNPPELIKVQFRFIHGEKFYRLKSFGRASQHHWSKADLGWKAETKSERRGRKIDTCGGMKNGSVKHEAGKRRGETK